MRYPSAFLICCLAASYSASGAPAQAGRVDHVEIIDYGIVAGPPGIRNGTSSNGIPHFYVDNARVVRTTTKIPACIGEKFGFFYSIVGSPNGMPVTIVDAVVFPQAGLHKPDAPFPIHDTRFVHAPAIGSRNGTWYEFDTPWELVPGEWAIEVWDANHLLASKTFTVVAPKPGLCPNLSS